MTRDMRNKIMTRDINNTRGLSPCAMSPCATILCNRFVVTLLLLMVGVSGVKADDITITEGVYYFGSHGYNKDNPTTNFYLCPTEPNDVWPYYYSTESPYYTSTNTGMPFMTTYPCRDGNYDSKKAVWVVKDAGNGYFRIIHVVDGKYLTYNGVMGNGSNKGRMRIHLQETDGGDNALFQITYVQSLTAYDITSKNVGPDNNRKYLNVTGNSGNGNQNSLIGEDTKTDGPNSINVGGLIGLWTSGSSGDNASKWYPESTLLTAPTISDYDASTEKVTITENNSLPVGYNIRYTFSAEGTPDDPTATTTVADTPNEIPISGPGTLKVVIERYGVVLTEVSDKTITKVATPTFSIDASGVTIQCTTDDATIYYATSTDGGENYSNYEEYTGILTGLDPDTYIKAKATKMGSINSDESEPYIVHPICATPTISVTYNDDGTATVDITNNDTNGAPVYYTTDGSTPTSSSTPYSASFDVTSGMTVKAIAINTDYNDSGIAEETITQVSTPVIAIVNNEITISCETDDATIYYIVDSDEPTVYAGALGLSDNVSGHAITAYATKSSMVKSANAEATANDTKLTLPTPTIAIEDNDVVAFSTDPIITGMTYKYTLDGTDPSDSNGTECTGSITLGVQAIVKVVSTHSNYVASDVVTLFNNPDVTLSQDTYTYNNTACEPTVSKVSITISETEYEAPTTPTPTYAIDGYVNNINAGTATVNLVDNDDSDNIFFSNFSKDFTINPAALTITPDNGQSKSFGDPDPVLTYANVGLVEGDELTGALGRAAGEDAGTYAITQGTLDNSHNPNYTITVITTGKTFTITAKSLGSGTTPAENITIEITEADEDHVTVKQGGTPLRVGTTGTDYDYSISTTGSATTKYYEVTIEGANNYTGSFTTKFANVTFGTKNNRHYWGGFVSDDGDGDFTVPSDMAAYIVTGINASTGTVEVELLDNIPEQEPVLLLTNKDAHGFIVKTKTDGTAPTGNLLEEAATDMSVTPAQIYVLYKGEFVLNAAGTLKAGKVYLPRPAEAPAPAILTIDFGGTSGIEEIPFSTTDAQLSTGWYTLEGIKLNGRPVKKGLYLRDGKKIVVK